MKKYSQFYSDMNQRNSGCFYYSNNSDSPRIIEEKSFTSNDDSSTVIEISEKSLIINKGGEQNDVYLPEYNLCDSIPELPILPAINDNQTQARISGLSSSQALLLLQKSLTVILTLSGFHGTHKLPFEVLSDLLLHFFIKLGTKIQVNCITNEMVCKNFY